MTPLGVVLDGVIRAKPDPLRQGTVLPLLLGQGALRAEGLLGRLFMYERNRGGGRGMVERLDKGREGGMEN